MSSFRRDQRGVFLLEKEIHNFIFLKKTKTDYFLHLASLFPAILNYVTRVLSSEEGRRAVDSPTVVALKVPPPPPLKTSCGLSERFVTPPLPFPSL